MAHERVYAHSDPTWLDPESPGPWTTSEPGRKPGVQVQFDRDAQTVGVATGHLTEVTFDASDPTHDAVTWPYFVWLTRSELNHLVRVLRRARSVAFGPDE